MTASFEKLVQVALLGTERQAPPAPSGETPLAKIQQEIDCANRERALLSMAALASAHERIGTLPSRQSSAKASAAPTERTARVNEQSGNALARLLKSEFGAVSTELLAEWLQLAARSNHVALTETLPSLLELGSSDPALRELILPVLGERGRWLGGQNTTWAWVHASESVDPSIWETGSAGERLACLRTLRRTDPAKAREQLASTWTQETPEDRGHFLEAFETGLSMADEDFLERALTDKRKEVRAGAAQLLLGIPSRFAAGLTARALTLLKLSRAEERRLLKLKRAKPDVIEIDIAAVDEELGKLPFSSKPPKGTGEKAWRVIQLLEMVPLDTWTDSWKLAPGEIVNASLAGEWKADLLEGWIRATLRQKRSEWAEPLFSVALAAEKTDRLADLLSVMQPEAAEAHLAELLEAKGDTLSAVQASLLGQACHAWTPAFSREVLAWLRGITAKESYDWQTRNNLLSYVPRLAPDVLPEVKKDWPTESKGWDFWRPGVDDLISAAQFRDEMIRGFTPPA